LYKNIDSFSAMKLNSKEINESAVEIIKILIH